MIKENQNLIYKICLSYCPEPESRKDLQQEILVQLWNSFPKFNGNSKVSTWLYRIALNTAISFYRNDCKHKAQNSSIDASIISLTIQDDNAETDEKISLLYRFIEQLNEFDKALILLYLDGNKQKEIAEIMGITATNVATKINRIKKRLKQQLSNQ